MTPLSFGLSTNNETDRTKHPHSVAMQMQLIGRSRHHSCIEDRTTLKGHWKMHKKHCGWVITGPKFTFDCEFVLGQPLCMSLHPPVEDRSAPQQGQTLACFAPSTGIAPATAGLQPDSVNQSGYMEATKVA